MKTKLAQFVLLINKLDPRQLRVAYFALMVGMAVLWKSPYDGGGGPI